MNIELEKILALIGRQVIEINVLRERVTELETELGRKLVDDPTDQPNI